jgi:hypothetical protein
MVAGLIALALLASASALMQSNGDHALIVASGLR